METTFPFIKQKGSHASDVPDRGGRGSGFHSAPGDLSLLLRLVLTPSQHLKSILSLSSPSPSPANRTSLSLSPSERHRGCVYSNCTQPWRGEEERRRRGVRRGEERKGKKKGKERKGGEDRGRVERTGQERKGNQKKREE